MICCMVQQKVGVQVEENKIRKRLRSERISQGLSQERVANIIGVSRCFYNQIENGNRNPRYETIKKIESLFRIGVNHWD